MHHTFCSHFQIAVGPELSTDQLTCDQHPEDASDRCAKCMYRIIQQHSHKSATRRVSKLNSIQHKTEAWLSDWSMHCNSTKLHTRWNFPKVMARYKQLSTGSLLLVHYNSNTRVLMQEVKISPFYDQSMLSYPVKNQLSHFT